MASKPATIATISRLHSRPMPPDSLFDDIDGKFVAAPELHDWARAVFIESDGALYNPDHSHLEGASIGFLWTNVANTRAGRSVIGQAEMGSTIGGMGRWAKARARQQVRDWFGSIPDFVMTIDAVYARECGDVEFCALVEHELYHMGQQLDEFGAPKFTRSGRPVYAMRGHDVEEFVGVVRRYGAVGQDVAALVAAANRGAEIGSVRIAQACGTCQGRRVAY